MLDLAAIEAPILALLAPLSTAGVVVRKLPDTPQQQGVVDSAGAVIVLAVMGGAATGAGSQDGQFQPVAYEVVLEMRSQQLRGELGLYSLIQSSRRLVAGQQIAGLGLLRFASWELLERNGIQGYWGAAVRFTATAMDTP